jgi:hypothetical protein
MTTSTRPELGELTVGQPVMVRRSPNDMRGRPAEQRYIPAKVVKVARVWVTLEGQEPGWRAPRQWRMRLDRQDEGTQYSGSNASFLTMDQHAWDETAAWALATLQDHGIDLRSNSPWRGREIELADHLAKIDPHDTDGEGNGS